MKKVLCLLAALTLALTSFSCQKIEARMEIKTANEAYQKEDYAAALQHYGRARKIDPSFPELERMMGYSQIGLYIPDDKTPPNEQHADQAIAQLSSYLRKKPEDRIARDALINMYLNANRTSQAIDYFRNYLAEHPADLEAVKSIATLYAKQGDFNQSLSWYEKITLLDSKNPESHYIYGVVCYEKVAKNGGGLPQPAVAAAGADRSRSAQSAGRHRAGRGAQEPRHRDQQTEEGGGIRQEELTDGNVEPCSNPPSSNRRSTRSDSSGF